MRGIIFRRQCVEKYKRKQIWMKRENKNIHIIKIMVFVRNEEKKRGKKKAKSNIYFSMKLF